jgi:RNA polymerase sigma-70 factor (ECF subfamily)
MGGEESVEATRPIVYCVVPRVLATALHDPLRKHFRDNPTVEVIVESRTHERRTIERRRTEGDARVAADRRRIRGRAGRRVGNRRALTSRVGSPELPRRLAPYRPQLKFIERVEPSDADLEDLDSARLIVRLQAGEPDVFALLYMRYFDRVYGYMRLLLRDRYEAEDASQQIFLKIFEALPQYERRGAPFRAWLFAAARNLATDHLRKQGKLDLPGREEIERHQESVGAEEEPTQVPSWISDPELVMFIERLPLAQRQVLALRYLAGFNDSEIASILGRSQGSVAMLHFRALRFLRARLRAVGRASTRGGIAPVRAWSQQARVLRARRFALIATGPVR